MNKFKECPHYIVIGGSSGLGLAIVKELIKRDCSIVIYDIKEPEYKFENVTFHKFDLCKDDINSLLSEINDSNGIIYTAGLGRVDYFNNYSFNEIEIVFSVNTISLIKIITLSNHKILSKSNFYFMCVSSIAGLVSSPLFSIYSASKAGVCKYVEAVNTELEKLGFENRITNIVATSFPGTCFNGGNTELEKLENIAHFAIDSMFNRIEIVKINGELIDSIINRYITDNKKFSRESYDYKINNKRINNC